MTRARAVLQRITQLEAVVARAELDRDLRQVLAELELVSAGTIYSYNPVGTKTGFSSSLPVSGDASPPHIHYRQIYNAQNDDWGRRQVIKQARDALDKLKRRTIPDGWTEKPEDTDDRTERLLRLGEGVPLHEAAMRLNCAPSELRQLRKDAKRDVYLGEKLPDQTARTDREDLATRARQLKQQNPRMSNREIGRKLNVSHVTIATYLAKSA